MSEVFSLARTMGDLGLLLCLAIVSNFSACIVYEQGKKRKAKTSYSLKLLVYLKTAVPSERT